MSALIAYVIPPPPEVTAAVQALAPACHSWPQRPIEIDHKPSPVEAFKPVAPADQLAVNTCVVATGQFSVAPLLWTGAGLGIGALMMAFLVWRFLRAAVGRLRLLVARRIA